MFGFHSKRFSLRSEVIFHYGTMSLFWVDFMRKKTYELDMREERSDGEHRRNISILLGTGFFARSIERPYRPLVELHLSANGVGLPHVLTFREMNGRLYYGSMQVGVVTYNAGPGCRPCLTLNDEAYTLFNTDNEHWAHALYNA